MSSRCSGAAIRGEAHQDRFVAVLDGNRLSKTERTYIFDGGADVIAYGEQVAIMSSRAFEELFSNETLRRKARAVRRRPRVPLANSGGHRRGAGG